MNALISKLSYANLVKRAVYELDGSPMVTAFIRLRRKAYGRLRGHFDFGKRKRHADDIALQALSDAAVKLQRKNEFDSGDWK